MNSADGVPGGTFQTPRYLGIPAEKSASKPSQKPPNAGSYHGLSGIDEAFSRTAWETVVWRKVEYARLPTFPRWAVSKTGIVILASTGKVQRPTVKNGKAYARLTRHRGDDLQEVMVQSASLSAIAWRDVDTYRRRKALRNRLVINGDGRKLRAYH